jgi:hypothetical protein
MIKDNHDKVRRNGLSSSDTVATRRCRTENRTKKKKKKEEEKTPPDRQNMVRMPLRSINSAFLIHQTRTSNPTKNERRSPSDLIKLVQKGKH